METTTGIYLALLISAAGAIGLTLWAALSKRAEDRAEKKGQDPFHNRVQHSSTTSP